MCVIIWSPDGKIPKDHVLNAMVAHPDGWGFAVPTGKGITTCRSTDFKRFINAWVARPAGPVLLHARWASCGEISQPNCHPFRVRGHNMVAAHNGTIAGYGSDEVSDTRDFIAKVLEPMPQRFDAEPAIVRALEAALAGSKMVLLRAAGPPTILNEGLGIWKGGRWYSNHTAF